jgi:hypothetical protein
VVIRDTQSSRKIDVHGYRGVFFLTFGFKDVQYGGWKPDSQALDQEPIRLEFTEEMLVA